MKLLKSFFLFISVYGAFMGCSVKNDPVASVCYIATVTHTYGSDSTVGTYTYTDNKVVAISGVDNSGSTTTYDYNYDSRGRVSAIVGPNASNNATLTYDTRSRISEMILSTSKTVFTYNSFDQLVRADTYLNGNSTSTPDYYSTYIYPSTGTKNYSARMDYDGSHTLRAIFSFAYDTKQNPEAVIFPTYQLPTNNVTQRTVLYRGSNGSAITDFIYTYNANGFPLTVTEKNGNSYTTTITYTYTNCK